MWLTIRRVHPLMYLYANCIFMDYKVFDVVDISHHTIHYIEPYHISMNQVSEEERINHNFISMELNRSDHMNWIFFLFFSFEISPIFFGV